MANPTIGATTPRIQYTATASQTVFTVPFEFLANADLAVYVNGTLKTLTTDYTLTGANTTGGGSLTFVTGRTAGEIVTILSNLAYSRDTNKYTKYGLLPAEVLEADFDALQVQAKQLALADQFAIRAPLSDTGSPAMTLPVVATRASKALGFDASGNPTVSASSLADIDSTVQIIDALNALPAGASSSISYQPAGTGAVTTTVQTKLRETVSVKDFGAVGDGVTDDTVAIQAALNSAAKQVVFPAGGIYIVNGGLSVSTVSQVIYAAGATIKLKASATTKYIITTTVGATDVVFDGGTWDGNKANGNATGSTYDSYSIGMFADRCTVKNIDSINTYGIGVKGFANYLSILNNRIRNTTHYGIFLDGSASVSNTGNRAIGNTIDMSEGGTIGQGILFTAGTGQNQTDWELSDNNVSNVDSGSLTDQAINLAVRGRRGIVSNNTTRYGSMGFSEGGDQTVITGNRFLDLRGTTRYGIEPSGGETTITGNVVTNALRGISASGNFTYDYLVISGNRISSDTTSGYAIYLQISVGYTGQNCVISGNSMSGAYAVYLQRNTTNTVINGNVITGPGSGVNSRGIYVDTPSSNAYVFVQGNCISKFQRAYAFYSASALTVNHVYAIANNCANDVSGSQTWNVEGSATTGTPVVVAWSATPAGFADTRLDILASTRFLFGSGTPEAAQTAGVGSIYLRQNGGAGTSFYVKESGTGNTGWVAK